MDVSPILTSLEARILEEGIETVAPGTGIEVAEVTIKQEIGSDEEKDPDDEVVGDEEINDEVGMVISTFDNFLGIFREFSDFLRISPFYANLAVFQLIWGFFTTFGIFILNLQFFS